MSTVFHLLSVMLANDFFATSVSLRAGVDLHTRSRVGFSRSWLHSSQQASSQASVFQSATVSGSSGNSPLEIGQILLMSTVDTTTGKGKVMYATVGVQCHEPVVPSTLLDSGLQCPEGLAIQTISDSSFHLYVADPCLGRIKHYLIQRTGDLLESHGSTTITTSEANAVSIDSHTGDLFFTVNGTTSSAVATIKASTLEMLLEGSCHADSLVTVPQSEVEERAEAYRILRDEAASGVLDEPAVGCEVFFIYDNVGTSRVDQPGTVVVKDNFVYWASSNSTGHTSIVSGSKRPGAPAVGSSFATTSHATHVAQSHGILATNKYIFWTGISDSGYAGIYGVKMQNGGGVIYTKTQALGEAKSMVWDGHNTAFVSVPAYLSGGPGVYSMAVGSIEGSANLKKCVTLTNAAGVALWK